MNSENRLMTVILGPHTSEKTNNIAELNNQIAFKVAPFATKRDVKQAAEKIFDVKVKKVTLVNIKGKTKQFSQRKGRRKDVKKAYVTLHEGHDINFATTE